MAARAFATSSASYYLVTFGNSPQLFAWSGLTSGNDLHSLFPHSSIAGTCRDVNYWAMHWPFDPETLGGLSHLDPARILQEMLEFSQVCAGREGRLWIKDKRIGCQLLLDKARFKRGGGWEESQTYLPDRKISRTNHCFSPSFLHPSIREARDY